ncbi:MAG: protein kinase domain-containing protein [Limisphaerales bacterium]
MSIDPLNPEPTAFSQPVSAFAGPIAELVGHRLLSPPSRPGLLATLSRYEVLRVLGSGGMGIVLMARDVEAGRDVAIKLVRPELVSNLQTVHRFVKEAGHLQKLRHKNVVPVLEVSDRPQGPYFVMPYFEGGSLAQRVRPGEPLEAGAVLEIARQVAEGLQFAHRRGIIHRDLKPANILLGPGQSACLADFGLARSLFNDSIIDVEREQIEGTAPYMSPGIAAGNAEDTRCDIYAFGALLYEMLTGDPPYTGRSTADIRKQILAGPPAPIKARAPGADPGLTIVAEGAMARELRDRYADMSDVLADLERIQQGKKPLGPHGLVRRVRRTPATVFIPVGLALCALLLWSIWPSHTSQVMESPPSAKTNAVPAPPAQSNAVQIVPGPVSVPVTVPSEPIPSNITVSIPPPNEPAALIAGQLGVAGNLDGAGTAAQFRSPGGIAVDQHGNLLVADTGNHTIRKITPDGMVTTVAGRAGKPAEMDGLGAEARFLAPLGIAVDSSDNVYVAEFATDTIRKITPPGAVTTLAGMANIPGSENGSGAAGRFRNPWAVAVDSKGDLFISDKSNFTVRKITPWGTVSTYAGYPGLDGNADGFATAARFNDPHGLAVDSAGNVYVADSANNAVRKIAPSGETTTFYAELSNPQSIAVDGLGAVYVTDTEGLHKISPRGQMINLPPVSLTAGPGGPFATPSAIAVDAKGNLYIADSANNVICRQPAQKQ